MKTATKRKTISYVGLILLPFVLLACTQSISQSALSPIGTQSPTITLPAKDPAGLIKYYATETAIAKSNPVTLATSLAPTLAATTVPQSHPTLSHGIEWRKMPVIGPVIISIENLGDNPILVAIITSLLTLLVVFSNKVLSMLQRIASWLWSLINLRGKDYAFEQEYLDWIVNQHRHLGILPAQIVARKWGDRQQLVDLEDVYVDLSISTSFVSSSPQDVNEYSWMTPSRFVRFLRWVARFVFSNPLIRNIKIGKKRISESWYFSTPIIESGNPSVIIENNSRIVLRGDPGSGKTTLLRYLAVTCARALRQNIKDGDRSTMIRDRLFWIKKPFPILLKLSKHSNVIKWEPDRSLIEAFRDELPADLRKRCPIDFFERRLKERPCLILLDAFDELGSPLARAEMAQRIGGFLEVYEKPIHRIIVTTRIVGYEGQLNRLGFHVRTIQPLQDGDVRSLIKLRYHAIGVSEGAGRNEIESKVIMRKISDRAQSLISRIENTAQLRLLASNPMLLSLIVLVHFLKVELPDERVLLYRDCVEILTERWQQYKREEAGATNDSRSPDDLTLTQKLVLLREIAYAMQQKKDINNSQALIRKDFAIRLIMQTLPDILGLAPNKGNNDNLEEYRRYAENWVLGIQETSGILAEQGLDQDGEPLIGFSHLTFQEYLAAIAIHEVPKYQAELWQNLMNPSWREVILLFVVLTNDATPVIESLLESNLQPQAALLAGRCLLERVKKINSNIQIVTLEKIKDTFAGENKEFLEEAGYTLGHSYNDEIYDFLIRQLQSSKWETVGIAVRAIGDIRLNSTKIVEARNTLVKLLETDSPLEIKVATRESLARMGDPRFINDQPILLHIPAQSISIVHPYKHLYVKINDVNENSIVYNYLTRFLSTLTSWGKTLLRNIDVYIYVAIRKKAGKNYTDDFYISEYPITIMEYQRFVDETGFPTPRSWIEGVYSQEKATHPVSIDFQYFSILYCRWLSKKTGILYRLPTEREWEIAAGGPLLLSYPWGNEYVENNANTREAGFSDTTPVGTYYHIKSPFGLKDTCGNVREVTRATIFSSSNIFLFVALLIASILFVYFTPALFKLFGFGEFYSLAKEIRNLGALNSYLIIKQNFTKFYVLFAPLFYLTYLWVAYTFLRIFRFIIKDIHSFISSSNNSRSIFFNQFKGGSWMTSKEDAVSYNIPTEDETFSRDIGFRVATNFEKANLVNH